MDTQPPATHEYRITESTTEANEAIEVVTSLATREMCLFDATPHALRDKGFGSAARIEKLREILRITRSHRLRIVLHETAGIETELPRLLNLQTQFSGQIAIHRSAGRAREARDSLAIADDSHFWRKLHVEHPRSVVSLHSAKDAKPICERFEEIWESSEPTVFGSSLGL